MKERISGQLTPDRRSKLFIDAVQNLQEIERSYQGLPETTFRVGNETIELLEVGDLHIGSIATDHKLLFTLRDRVLSEPNVYLIPLGDEIEGLKMQYLNTNTARTPIDVQAQIDILKNIFLSPLQRWVGFLW